MLSIADKKKTHLVLFFTYGISLKTWTDVGMFDREVALYKHLQSNGIQMTFVTYGDKGDLKYGELIPGIDIFCNRWRLPNRVYARIIPFIFAPWLLNCDIIKSNQTNGSIVAFRAARLWRKFFIARCGFMWSEFVSQQQGPQSLTAQRSLDVEETIFKAADRVVVTTQAMADNITQRLPSVRARIQIIPNYVDTNLFAPDKQQQPEFDIMFVGRLSPQKNVLALLEAVQSLQIRTLFIGDGELHEILDAAVNSNSLLSWQRNIPNSDLPKYLNRARLFVLPSHYEGHPKTLIEAMACGLPVIGADSPGIRELIRHKDTGWLCGTTVDSIKTAITSLLEQPQLQAKLGKNARNYVIKHFSLLRVVQLELALLTDLTGVKFL